MSHLKLYLDDERACPEGWTPALTVEAASHIITQHMAGDGNTFEVSLDYDLGEDGDMVHEKGTMLIFFFIDTQLYPTNVFLHTGNPVGRKNMEWALVDMQKARVLDDQWDSGAYA